MSHRLTEGGAGRRSMSQHNLQLLLRTRGSFSYHPPPSYFTLFPASFPPRNQSNPHPGKPWTVDNASGVEAGGGGDGGTFTSGDSHVGTAGVRQCEERSFFARGARQAVCTMLGAGSLSLASWPRGTLVSHLRTALPALGLCGWLSAGGSSASSHSGLCGQPDSRFFLQFHCPARLATVRPFLPHPHSECYRGSLTWRGVGIPGAV